MSELKVVARLTIRPGLLDSFKTIAAKCKESVREKDTGTLQYDWFMNADETECVVLETYRDSNAVLEHVVNLGELLPQLMSVGEMSLEVYGEPAAELVAATAELAPRIYAPFE